MNKKIPIMLALMLGFSALESKAQLAVGTTAPDFTMKDTKGVSHTLYNYLNSGKVVVMDIFATWCGPCWSYHNSGALESFYEKNGPEGTNKGMAMMIEADGKTNTACLSGQIGCVGGTAGNWLNGAILPILDPTATEVKPFNTAYKLTAYPTIYMICPDKKIIYKGQGTAATFQTNMAKCATSSAKDAGLGSHVSVYPNISSGSIYIDVSAEGPARVSVDVYNAMGGVLFAKNADAPGPKAFKFDLTAQRNGVYFVQVKTAAGMITRKIILEK
jgi:thiol-disulfide isomerase/thioredoxin